MAKAFLFSDLHSSSKQLSNMEALLLNKEFDLLIFAGDFVNMGEPVWFTDKFINVLNKINQPFLWVPGNNDFGRSYYKLNAKYKSLEGRVEQILARTFTGVGGSPASWAGQYAGESMIDKKKIGGSIFVSHVPPPTNINLRKFDIGNPKSQIPNPKQIKNSNVQNPKQFGEFENSDLEFVSSLELRASDLPQGRRFSDAPLVHICGHLHYRWGTAYLGQTKVIQLASLETGHYAIIDLETLAVEFKKF